MNMNIIELSADECADGLSLSDLIIRADLSATRAEVRRLVSVGLIYVNGIKTTDCKRCFCESDLQVGVTICVGKKHKYKFVCSQTK